METRDHVLLALERAVAPVPGPPAAPAAERSEPRLNISVVFTSTEATTAALEKAGELAAKLRARIILVVPQLVPYPLPLSSPPVLLDWNEERFQLISRWSPVETVVRILLCRDRLDMLKRHLPPRSLVVVGGRSSWWWATREVRMARNLRRAGHQVIFAEME